MEKVEWYELRAFEKNGTLEQKVCFEFYENRGTGLKTTKAIKAGEVILCSKVISAPSEDGMNGLARRMAQAKEHDFFLQFASDRKMNPSKKYRPKDCPPETFQHLVNVCNTNCFGCNHNGEPMYVSFSAVASMFNHTCGMRNNAFYVLTGTRISFVAKRNIRKGEEVTINYGYTPKKCKCVVCTKKVKPDNSELSFQRKRDLFFFTLGNVSPEGVENASAILASCTSEEKEYFLASNRLIDWAYTAMLCYPSSFACMVLKCELCRLYMYSGELDTEFVYDVGCLLEKSKRPKLMKDLQKFDEIDH